MTTTPARGREQVYPWAVVAGTLALSMAGNALHAISVHGPAVSDDTAAWGAVVPPALAAVALHGLLRVWRRQHPGPARSAVMVLVVAVFGMAFTLSFAGLHALALAIGISPLLAPLGPLIVDVTTVYAVADAMLLHRRPVGRAAEPPPAADPEPEPAEPLPDLLAMLDVEPADTVTGSIPPPLAVEPTPAAAPAAAVVFTEPALPTEMPPADDLDDADGRDVDADRTPVSDLDDAAELRAEVCAAIVAERTAGRTPSSRALAATYDARESTVRGWIARLDDGRWTVAADGELVTDAGQRERAG